MTEPAPNSSPHQTPLLVVISGTSGAGKDSVVECLRQESDEFEFIVTVTSRPRRSGEREGYDYVFVSEDEFRRMAANGEFWEHADVYGQNKGVPRRHVEQALAGTKDVLMRVDVQGAETVRHLTDNQAVTVFIDAPDLAELEQRLRRREADSEEQIQQRLNVARGERQRIPEFDYLIFNREGCLAETVAAVRAIIQAEHHRTQPREARL